MSTRFYKEEVGFEPTERVNVRQFSRLLQSTALALLQTVFWIPLYCTCTKFFVNIFFYITSSSILYACDIISPISGCASAQALLYLFKIISS